LIHCQNLLLFKQGAGWYVYATYRKNVPATVTYGYIWEVISLIHWELPTQQVVYHTN